MKTNKSMHATSLTAPRMMDAVSQEEESDDEDEPYRDSGAGH